MPTYVYRNLVTGETFEIKQRITEDALTAHPETGDPVKRLIQPVGIAFKGSGFYINDSRSQSGGRKAAGAPEAAAKPVGESTAASSSSSETKTGTPSTSTQS